MEEVLTVGDDVVFPWTTVSPNLYRGVIAEQEARYKEPKQINQISKQQQGKFVLLRPATENKNKKFIASD